MSGIMLVTADKELARLVKKALLDTPARVTTECATAREAADVFAKAAPNLVILDLFLPASSGHEVLKVLKRINEQCLFVMLSRMRTRNVIEKAFRLGAQDVLLYPSSMEVVRDTILHRLKDGPVEEAPAAASEETAAKPGRKAKNARSNAD